MGGEHPWQFFASFPDPGLAEAVRNGRRGFSQFAWGEQDIPDPMSPATVERSTLNWKELSVPDHRSMLELYRGLIALRHEYPELADPRLDAFPIETGPGSRWLVCTGATSGWSATWPAGEQRPPGPARRRGAAGVGGVTHAGRVLAMPPESFAVVTG